MPSTVLRLVGVCEQRELNEWFLSKFHGWSEINVARRLYCTKNTKCSTCTFDPSHLTMCA